MDAHAKRMAAELAIATKLVDLALADRRITAISMESGEEDETTLERTRDRAAIIGNFRIEDFQSITLWREPGKRFGVVWLIWGNGTDLIHDYSGECGDGSEDDWMRPVCDLADKLSLRA